jgi:hypothetical protein
VVVTDTIPRQAGGDDGKVTILSVAPLFGEAIRRIHRGESVGALFSSEVDMVEEMTFWSEDAESDDAPENDGAPAADDAADGEREPFRVGAG